MIANEIVSIGFVFGRIENKKRPRSFSCRHHDEQKAKNAYTDVMENQQPTRNEVGCFEPLNAKARWVANWVSRDHVTIVESKFMCGSSIPSPRPSNCIPWYSWRAESSRLPMLRDVKIYLINLH